MAEEVDNITDVFFRYRCRWREGDLAVIRPQPDVDSGDIAAVMIEGILPQATLKIVRKTRHTLKLLAANPYYPLLRFVGREREKVKIIGKYVGLVRVV